MTAQDWKRAADLAMDRYARGDDGAFAELYDLLSPRLYAFLVRRTREAAQAEDILQQTFLQMHGARGHFAPGGAVMPWAFSIARRLLIDRFRAQHRESVAIDDIDSSVPALRAPGTAPDDMASLRRLTRHLERELAGLPEHYRVAFELIQIDGLSMAEAAEVLGTTVAAIKVRAHRAYEALRKKLGPAALETL
jgi:RNA polymerase sigma-70 factor (ECF subfamily)